MSADLRRTASELAADLADGTTTSVELTQASLDRIAAMSCSDAPGSARSAFSGYTLTPCACVSFSAIRSSLPMLRATRMRWNSRSANALASSSPIPPPLLRLFP